MPHQFRTHPGKIFSADFPRARLRADLRGRRAQQNLERSYTTSGEPPPVQRWKFAIEPKEPASAIAQASRTLALWRTRISRSLSANSTDWLCLRSQLLSQGRSQLDPDPFLDRAKMCQPTLLIAGDRDEVLGLWEEEVEVMESTVPNLTSR
jgi:hypothetical protein